MTVKELIIALLECDMNAEIELEVPTQEWLSYSRSDNVVEVINNGKTEVCITSGFSDV